MALPFYNWSRTASNNATADSTVNWAEGQAPSSVNDSARAMMASTAAFRDDIAGAIVTGGTSTAYTVTSYQIFDSLAHLNGQMIAFTPHTTNGATVTLNVDSLGAKPLRAQPSVELQGGVLIQGTPYAAVYNSSDAAFYLFGVGSAPGIPLGAGMDFWGSTTPSSAFVFPTGQAISRTTYATLFSLLSTTYGTGDGSTTFNLPDKTGRISAMKEASATRLTSTYFGGNSTTLGATGGTESQTLSLAQLPTGITVTGTLNVSQPGGLTPMTANANITTFSTGSGGATQWQAWATSASTSVQALTATGTQTSNNTSGNAHPIVQPTIVCNYIIRVI